MAQKIERYLMNKFSSGLEKRGSRLRWYKQFEDIKTLLEKKLSSSLPETEKNSLREKLYLLNNTLSECQTLSRKRSWGAQEIDCAVAQNGNSSQPQNGDQIQASSSTAGEISHWTSTAESVDVSKVHGFDDEVLSLEKFLFQKETDDQFKAIGIVGTAGIGKTTLCQLIFDKAEVKNHFVPRIWVCMSRRPDEDQDVRVAIVKRMLTELGVEEETIDSVSSIHGLLGLLCALHLELACKRYLIVLEDAREREVWYGQLNSCLTRDGKWHERLAYGLPKGSGGAVIVTSGNEEIAKTIVGEKNLHHILPREDSESCWEIFKDAVLEDGNTEFDPSNVEDRKKEFKQK